MRRHKLMRWLGAGVAGAAGLTLAALVGVSAATGPSVGANQSFNGGQPLTLRWPQPKGGTATKGGSANAVARAANGDLLVAGTRPSDACPAGAGCVSDFDVAAVKPNGTIDTNFGTNGYATVTPVSGQQNVPQAIAVQSDGKIVLAGYTLASSAASNVVVARLSADGKSLDTTFDPTGSLPGVLVDQSGPSYDEAESAALDSSQRIVVAAAQGDVRRYTTAGALDLSFNATGRSALLIPTQRGHMPMAIQPDGKIVVAGTSAQIYPYFGWAARLNPDGSPDTSFGVASGSGACPGVSGGGCIDITPSGTSETVAGMTLQGSSIVLAGSSGAGPCDGMLARLTPAGHLDTTFGNQTGAQAGKELDPPPTGEYCEEWRTVAYDPYPSLLETGQSYNSSFQEDGTVEGINDGPSGAPRYSAKGPGHRGEGHGAPDIPTSPSSEADLFGTGEDDSGDPFIDDVFFQALDQPPSGTGTGTTSTSPPTTAVSTPTTTSPPTTAVSTPRTTTTTPPPAADVSVKRLDPGLYFLHNDFEMTPVGFILYKGTDGFKTLSSWAAGEELNLLLVIYNAGPSPASYQARADPAGSAKLTLEGWADGADGSKVVTLQQGPMPALAPETSRMVLMTLRLGRAGPLKIRASLYDVQPEDPTQPDNEKTITLDVAPAGSFGKVSVDKTGRVINGAYHYGDKGNWVPARDATHAADAARGAHTMHAGHILLAVERQTGKACSWLQGASGTFGKPAASACTVPVFVRASGFAAWSLRLKRPLAPGRYTALLEAQGPGGLPVPEFGPSLHDVASFTAP